MPGFLERLHTLWAALRLRLRGGAPGLFYIGGSDTMPALWPPIWKKGQQPDRETVRLEAIRRDGCRNERISNRHQ